MSATSSAFNITPAPASQLAIIQQPASTTTGVVLNPAVTVALEDPYGNIVTNNNTSVTLDLDGGVFASGQSNVTATPAQGVATFGNLAINAGGTYTLAAADGQLSGAISNPFTVYLFNEHRVVRWIPKRREPPGDIILDSSGDLFGTTLNGGANSDGTVFEVVHGSSTITTLASFNGANGLNPYGGVTLDSGGDLFGTTYQGGGSGDGTVFEIVHGSGSITTIASFNNTNGANPYAGVIFDSTGDLWERP